MTLRAVVYIQPAHSSIRVTGLLEAHGIPTMRCWAAGELRRIVLQAGPLIGAAVIGDDLPDMVEAIDSVRGIPLVTGTREGPYVAPDNPDDRFVMRILQVLNG